MKIIKVNPVNMSAKIAYVVAKFLLKNPTSLFERNLRYSFVHNNVEFNIGFSATIFPLLHKVNCWAVTFPEQVVGERGAYGTITKLAGYITIEHDSCVFKPANTENPKLVKQMLLSKAGVDTLNATREVNFLPPYFKAKGPFLFTNKIMLIFQEFKGESAMVFHETAGIPLPFFELLEIISQLLNILADLEQKNITHRDIKLENLLLYRSTAGIKLELVDYGFAKANDEITAVEPGTKTYAAIEILSGLSSSPATDMYSAGILLSYLMGCFERNNIDGDLKNYIIACKKITFEDIDIEADLKPLFQDFIYHMCHPEPSKRYNCLQAQIAFMVIIRTINTDYPLTPLSLIHRTEEQRHTDKLQQQCFKQINQLIISDCPPPRSEIRSYKKSLLRCDSEFQLGLFKQTLSTRIDKHHRISHVQLARNKQALIETIDDYLAKGIFYTIDYVNHFIKDALRDLKSDLNDNKEPLLTIQTNFLYKIERYKLTELKVKFKQLFAQLTVCSEAADDSSSLKYR